LLEQHCVSFKIWSESIRINTEGKSLIMKLDPWIYIDSVWFIWNWLEGVYQVSCLVLL